MSTEHVFVVRIWQQGEAGKASTLRGSVEHISSQERRYISHLEDMVRFIEARLQDPTGSDDGVRHGGTGGAVR